MKEDCHEAFDCDKESDGDSEGGFNIKKKNARGGHGRRGTEQARKRIKNGKQASLLKVRQGYFIIRAKMGIKAASANERAERLDLDLEEDRKKLT